MYMWSLENLAIRARLRGAKKPEAWETPSWWLTEEMIDEKRKTAFQTQEILWEYWVFRAWESKISSYIMFEEFIKFVQLEDKEEYLKYIQRVKDSKNRLKNQPLTEERIDEMRQEAFPSVLQRIKDSVKNIFNQEK